jgi:hypothetical protein
LRRRPFEELVPAVRALWAIRWKLGEVLGWDGPGAGLGARVPTLRERLPAGLREAPSGPDFRSFPFSSLYLLDSPAGAPSSARPISPSLRPRSAWIAGSRA